jgi:hypothetical protein
MSVAVLLYGSRMPVTVKTVDELRLAEAKFVLNRRSLRAAETKLLAGSPVVTLYFGETANAALYQSAEEPESVSMGDFCNEVSKNDVLKVTRAKVLE